MATTPGPKSTQISKVERGHFDAAGRWVHELRLNGDESGANSQPRIPPFPANKFLGLDRPMILKITVYRPLSTTLDCRAPCWTRNTFATTTATFDSANANNF